MGVLISNCFYDFGWFFPPIFNGGRGSGSGSFIWAMDYAVGFCRGELELPPALMSTRMSWSYKNWMCPGAF